MHSVHGDDVKLDVSPASGYAAPPRTAATTPDAHSLPSPPLLDRRQRTGSSRHRRFVAGTTFFNYNAYGSLRPGLDPIELFSSQYVGLALHFFLSGFVFYFFSYCYGRLLAEYLRANNDQQVYAAYYVLGWPSALSLGIGLIADCFPTCGYRRKGYMILGWLVSLAMYTVIFILDAYSGSDSNNSDHGAHQFSPFAITYLVVSLLAAIGIQISWIAAVAASVEYGQREHIHHRGRLQATLVALYYGGGVVARLVTNVVITHDSASDKLVSSLSVGGAAVILAAVTLGALPLIVCLYHEEPFSNTPHIGMALSARLQNFWKFCHQNVVYRVLFFTILHLFLLGLFNQNVRDAVQQWCSVGRDESLQLEVLRMATDVASVLVWKVFLRNVDWRRLVVGGTLLYIAAHAALVAFTAFNVVRNEAFYTAMLLVAEIPRAWLLLFTIILATEIADVGHEGVMVALVISYQTLAALADYTLSAISPDVLGLHVTPEDVARDASVTRFRVAQAFAAIAAVNLLCLPVIRLLPQQKLDAQQQRAFGGYNKHASLALLATFVVLLCFNLAINLMAVL